MEPRFRQFWAEQEKQIIKTQLEEKLKTMVTKGIYTPAWLAESSFKQQNSFIDFAYVKIPFDQIDDGDVTVEDADLEAYIKDHAYQFENEEETRQLDYAVFDVLPTSEDSLSWKTEIEELIEQFKSTDEDSIYAINNNGFYANYFYKAEELSDSIKNIVTSLQDKEVYGPFIEGNGYRALKLVESRMIPDSVRASHILISAVAGDANQLNTARTKIDSIKNLIDTRQERFDSLAVKFSSDPTTASKGGDLGYFVQGRMVPPFNDVCFYSGEEGGLYVVETQFGVHLVRVDDKKYLDRSPKYKIAFINVPIIPTQQTQDDILDQVSQLISSHPYLDDLTNVINERDDIVLESASNLKKSDFVFANLDPGNTSRDIIRWAFDPSTSTNDVSPEVHIFTDPVNYFNSKYVIIGLKEISKSGLRSVSSARNEIQQIVQNKKKGKAFLSNLDGKSLEAIATENQVSVDTLRQISYNSRFITGLGNEPTVLATAIRTAIGEQSDAVVGESGVFVVKTLDNAPATQANNVPQFRTIESANVRNQVNFQLLAAMKKIAKIKDNRFIFY